MVRNRFAIVILTLIFILLPWVIFAEESVSPSPTPTVSPSPQVSPTPSTEKKIDPLDLIRQIWRVNSRMSNYQGEISVFRLDENFMKDIFPSTSMQIYVEPAGVINYTRTPKVFHLLIYPRGRDEYYYQFASPDGYHISLSPSYKDIFPDPSLIPKVTLQEEDEKFLVGLSSPNEIIEKLSNPISVDKDGTYHFSKYNPLNLLFPFSFKPKDPNSVIVYRGKGKSVGYTCHLVDIDSPEYGRSVIYISDDENHFVRQIDRLDAKGIVYASALYKDFKQFRKGGWIYQTVEISVMDKPILTASVRNILSNQDYILIPGATRRTKREVAFKRRKKKKNTSILGPAPLLTVGASILVLFLMTILALLGYRYWFYKAERPAFAREVIVIEGDRPEERISHLLAELGIPNTPFTPEKLTEERKLLDFKHKKKPRVVVVGPGMISSVKGYSYLLKGYVGDGGRIVLFDHGVEHAKDLPFTPTFIPYDRSDPNYVFLIMPQWEKIWKETSLDEIHKRTAAFYPYELLVRIKEKNIKLDPIIVVNHPKREITAAAICLIKEGKGEYLLIQYRLLEAIKKLKFTSKTAEKMLRDLMNYMFGKEKRMEWFPPWLLALFGMK